MFFQVSKLGHYSEEIRRSLSEILLSVMNILLQKYKNIQSNNKRNVADQESFYSTFSSFFGKIISYFFFHFEFKSKKPKSKIIQSEIILAIFNHETRP